MKCGPTFIYRVSKTIECERGFNIYFNTVSQTVIIKYSWILLGMWLITLLHIQNTINSTIYSIFVLALICTIVILIFISCETIYSYYLKILNEHNILDRHEINKNIKLLCALNELDFCKSNKNAFTLNKIFINVCAIHALGNNAVFDTYFLLILLFIAV